MQALTDGLESEDGVIAVDQQFEGPDQVSHKKIQLLSEQIFILLNLHLYFFFFSLFFFFGGVVVVPRQ